MATKKKTTPPKATQKAKPKQRTMSSQLPEQPTGGLNWVQKLTVLNFKEALKLRDLYIANAKEFAKKAGTVSDEPNDFKYRKYSSAAGQFAYLSMLKFIQGFAAEYPLDAVRWQAISGQNTHEAKLIARENFESEGLVGLGDYKKYIQAVFAQMGQGNNYCLTKFLRFYDSFHVSYHYGFTKDKQGFYLALDDLERFLKEWEIEARKLLKAARVTT